MAATNFLQIVVQVGELALRRPGWGVADAPLGPTLLLNVVQF